MGTDKEERNRQRVKHKMEELKWDYLTADFVPFSFHGFTEFVLTAIRGIGKTVIAMDTILSLKKKYGYENVKAYWFRTADSSVKAGLKDNGKKLVSQFIINKYNCEITKRSNIIYDHDKPLVEVYPLTGAAKEGKGVEFYDPDFIDNRPINPKTGKPIKRFIVTVWDEFLMAEGLERRTVGDPVEQYKIYRESIYRDQAYINTSLGITPKVTKHKITTPPDYDFCYNLYLANNVAECAEVTARLFNYVPDGENHRVVKLTRQRAIFWDCPLTKNYKEAHDCSINGSILNTKDDANYAILERDKSNIKPSRLQLHVPCYLIKFDSKTGKKDKWFILWDMKYIKLYNNECIPKSRTIAMKRHIDNDVFDSDLQKNIIEAYDDQEFLYAG